MKRRGVAVVVALLAVAGVVAALVLGLRGRGGPRPVSAGPEPDGAVASAVVRRREPRDGGTTRQDNAPSATSATISGRVPDELRACADILIDGSEVELEDGAFETTVEATPEREHDVRLIANRLDMQIGRRRLRPGERWELGTLPAPPPRMLTFTTTSPHPVLLALGSSAWVRDGELKPDADDSLVFEGSAVVEVGHCDTLAVAQESETGRLSPPVDLHDAEGTVTLEFGAWQPVECASLPEWAYLSFDSKRWPGLNVYMTKPKGLVPPGGYDVTVETRQRGEWVSDPRLSAGQIGPGGESICPRAWPVGDVSIKLESSRQISGAYFLSAPGAGRTAPQDFAEANSTMFLTLIFGEEPLDGFLLRHVTWLDTLICVGVRDWADSDISLADEQIQLRCEHVRRDSVAEDAEITFRLP